jgi:hypothetical protein
MESATADVPVHTHGPAPARVRSLARTGPALAAWTLGFGPVLYLALRGGGYDLVVRSEVGLAAWWIVLVGILVGFLSLRGLDRTAWIAVGLLAAFTVWTGIAMAWTESQERTITEVGRLAAYLGFFVLALCVVRRNTVRQLLNGVGAAFGVLSVLAVLSRLEPSLFPANQVAEFFPGSQGRLSYPLNYANGTGEFLAIGIPLLLMFATGARTLAGRAAGAAALPVAVVGVVMTASRGGVLTAIVAIVAFYLLAPDRLPKLLTGLVAGAGAAILTIVFLNRHALRDALSTPQAVSQRHQVMLLTVVVCVIVAGVQVAITLAERRFPRPDISRRRAGWLTAAAIVALLAVAIAAGVPGRLSHQWRVFKRSDVTGVVSGNVYSRLGTAAGSNRYQYWRAAVHAFNSKPVTGIGPGTFEFYWAQHGSLNEFIRNAHSLYLETAAETGLVGFALIAAFLLVLICAGVARALRASSAPRTLLAAATAALLAFCTAAGFDWVWQLAVVPLVALLLGAAIVTADPDEATEAAPRERASWAARMPPVVVALCAIGAVAIPFGATAAIRASQAQVKAGHLTAALNDAVTAQHLEPYAATPRLQQAVILEQQGDVPAARRAIAQATLREPTNWRLWLVRARIDAESGHEREAARDYRRAHGLNPLSPATALGR